MKRLTTIILAMVMLLPVTFGVACNDGGDTDTTLSVFRWDFAGVNSAKKQGTAIYNEIYKNTGVNIKVVTCGSSAWEEVINKKFNTGDMPDIFVSYAMDRPTNYEKWIKDGAILPISDYVSETEYPNVYARLQKYDFLKERISYANGKHYALPIESSLTHGMYVRTDWIDNLNKKLEDILVKDGIIKKGEMTDEIYEQYKFKLPDTLLEFYRLARAFTKYDPDNNGRDDTYGYTCSEENMWFNNWIFEAMSSSDIHDSTYWGMVEDSSGNLTASWVTEGNKKAVAFLNKLYKEGILDPDYIGTTADQKNTNFAQGKVGIMVGNIWYNTIIQKMADANEGYTLDEAKNAFTIIPPPSGESGVSGLRGNYGFWCSVCISGKLSESKRKLALKFLDYLYSDDADELFTYGVEGVHYQVVGGEKVSLMGKDNKGFNYTLESKDAAFALSSLSSWMYSYYSPYQSNYEEIKKFMDNAKEYTKVDPVGYVQTPLYVSKDNVLANSAMEKLVNMIKEVGYYGSSDTVKNISWNDLYSYNDAYNTAWSNYVNDYLYGQGGAEMISEYNNAAKKYLK